jgi:hypothetical protein
MKTLPYRVVIREARKSRLIFDHLYILEPVSVKEFRKQKVEILQSHSCDFYEQQCCRSFLQHLQRPEIRDASRHEVFLHLRPDGVLSCRSISSFGSEKYLQAQKLPRICSKSSKSTRTRSIYFHVPISEKTISPIFLQATDTSLPRPSCINTVASDLSDLAEREL